MGSWLASRGWLLAGVVWVATPAPARAQSAAVEGELADRSLAGAPLRLERGGEGQARVQELLSGPLTAEGAVELALRAQPELDAALMGLRASEQLHRQARTLPNPHLELELALTEEGIEEAHGHAALEVDLTQALLTPARAGAARAQVEVKVLQAAAVAVLVAGQARSSWYAAATAMERLAQLRQAQALMEAAWTTAAELHRVGNLTDLQLATWRVQVEAARAATGRGELEAIARRYELAGVLGVGGAELTLAPLPEQLPEPGELPQLQAMAAERSLALATLRAERAAAVEELGLYRAQTLTPEVSAGLYAERGDHGSEVGLALDVELPLLDRGQGSRRAAQLRVAELDARIAAAEQQLRADVAAAYTRARASGEITQRLRAELLPAQEAAMRQSLLEYNAMQIDVFGLLIAAQSSSARQLEVVDATAAFWQARCALDVLLAGGQARSTATPEVSMARPTHGGDTH